MSGRSCSERGFMRCGWGSVELTEGVRYLAEPAGDVLMGDGERMAWLWASLQCEAGQQSDWQALQSRADMVLSQSMEGITALCRDPGGAVEHRRCWVMQEGEQHSVAGCDTGCAATGFDAVVLRRCCLASCASASWGGLEEQAPAGSRS